MSDLNSFPNTTRRAVFSVLMERGRQDVKWGAGGSQSLELWATILGEEYGEICRAILKGDLHDAREELVHVAAVAVAAIEDVDRRLRT